MVENRLTPIVWHQRPCASLSVLHFFGGVWRICHTVGRNSRQSGGENAENMWSSPHDHASWLSSHAIFGKSLCPAPASGRKWSIFLPQALSLFVLFGDKTIVGVGRVSDRRLGPKGHVTSGAIHGALFIGIKADTNVHGRRRGCTNRRLLAAK
jgi:hypothetical protein